VKITADTNVLVRAVMGDDPRQSKIAQSELANADVVALALPAICELVWVLSQGYRVPSADIGIVVRRLINSTNVVVNRPAADAGLAHLDAGGDFADGVIAAEGRWMGGETFVSFDRKATAKLSAQHHSARLLSVSQDARRTH
jgi:predicted nucleic-acid-binding protein